MKRNDFNKRSLSLWSAVSKYFLLLVSFLLCATSAVAQGTAPLVNNPIPPSPGSAVFRQFAGYTPNLATGTVNVPVPLYDIRVGDYTLPLSMQYYTQGIKVTDDPYPLGYGWILSPGLRVTRTIMGRPDMSFDIDVQTSPEDNYSYGRKAIYNEESGAHPDLSSTSSLIDTQHDIFTVHLPDGDHTFFLNKQSDGSYAAVTSNNLLKIVCNGLLGFTVTDGNGVVYHFGLESSSTTGDYMEIYHNRYYTAWMLRKVVLPGSGREIDLTWQYAYHTTLGVGNQAAGDAVKDYKENLGDIPADSYPTHTSAEEAGLLTEYGNYGQMLHLKQISFPGGQVDFTYKGTTNPLLSKLAVTNMFGTSVRTVDFTYGTGTSQALLLSAAFSDEGTYSFEYDSNRFTYTNGQDWWGYYNGKSNASLVPQMSIKVYNTRYSTTSTVYQTYGTADRSISAAAMQANILKKVTYPTGGYTAFEYEPHKFTGTAPTNTALGSASRIQLTQGGGLRVTKVTSSAGGSAPDVVKTYKYGTSENGLANVLYEPTMDTFIDELNGYSAETASGSLSKYGYNHRQLLLNAQSNYRRYAMNAPDLWYGTVTEYVEGAGKTVYTFQRIVPENTQGSETQLDFAFEYPVTYNTLFSKGCLLTNRTDYKLSGTTYSAVKSTAYSYSAVEESDKRISDAYVSRNTLSLLANGPDFYYSGSTGYPSDGTDYVYGGAEPDAPYTVNPLGIRFYYEQLNSKSTTHYTDQGNVTETENYTYAGYQLASKSTTGSDGKSLSEQFFYPKDYANTTAAASSAQQAILKNMLTKNIVTPIFKQVRTRNGSSEVSRTEFAYYHSSFYKPSKVYCQEACKVEYDYDVAGNVRSLTENGCLKSAFLWGYDYTVPVLEVKGLNYSELAPYIATYMSNVNGSTASTIATAVANAKSAADSYGSVTAYTWQPLTGILTEAQPNGNKTTYAYDSAGRLSTVKDNSSYTVQAFEYNLLNGAASSGSGSGTTTNTTVQFTYVNQGSTGASATISCNNSCTVEFYLNAECSEDGGYAEYMLDGNYYTVYGIGGQSVSLTLESGSHSFTVSLDNAGSGSSGSITIQGVNSPNTLGTTLSIQASN